MSREMFVPGIPVPQGSKKPIPGRMIEVAGHRLTQWRTSIGWHAKAAGWARDPILAGPVRVDLRFVLARPKTHGSLTEPPYWHAATPDADKVARAVLDALTQAHVWTDDRQVAQLHVVKHYGSETGVWIKLEALDPAASGTWVTT